MGREKNGFRLAVAIFAVIAVVISLLIGLLISRGVRSARQNDFAGEMSKLSEDLSKTDTASTQIGKSVEQAEEDADEQLGYELPTLNEQKDDTKNNASSKGTDKSSNKKNTGTEKNSTTETTANANSENSTTANKNTTAETNSDTNSENSTTTKKNSVAETNTDANSENSSTAKKNTVVETNAENLEKNSKNAEKQENIKFEAPIKGEILRGFAKDSLVFSNTLQEWVTHNGVDIKADKTSVVKAAAKGTVSAIKNDPRYGLTVIINHDNGYQTIYSNLLTAEFVVKGEKVEVGQSIGTVGNSASFEVEDEYHLHFEVLKDNEYLDPTQFMNF